MKTKQMYKGKRGRQHRMYIRSCMTATGFSSIAEYHETLAQLRWFIISRIEKMKMLMKNRHALSLEEEGNYENETTVHG